MGGSCVHDMRPEWCGDCTPVAQRTPIERLLEDGVALVASERVTPADAAQRMRGAIVDASRAFTPLILDLAVAGFAEKLRGRVSLLRASDRDDAVADGDFDREHLLYETEGEMLRLTEMSEEQLRSLEARSARQGAGNERAAKLFASFAREV